MKRVLPLLFGLLFIQSSITFAQKYSNEFLSIGVGARAQALGNAVVAGIDDVTAGIWNPAGLALLSREDGLQLGAMHSEWFGGVGNFDYLGATLPLAADNRRLAFSLVRFGIDQIPNTLSLYEPDGTINFNNIVEFSAADYAFFLSYAQELKVKETKLLVGGNVKVIYRQIGPFATSWGFGLDLGLQYRPGNWRFGLVAKDVTSTFNAWSFSFTDDEKEVLSITGNEVPIETLEITNPQVLLGAGYRFQFNKIGLAPELDFIITTDGQRNTLVSASPFSIDPAFGLEADYNQFIFLRAGINQFQRELDFDNTETLIFNPSIGVGLVISSLRIDYAFTNPGTNSDDNSNRFNHVISLMLNFRSKK